jgi:GNAT superfamily N-acetyltransferase
MTEITYRDATTADIKALAALRWRMETERGGVIMPLEEYSVAYEAAIRGEVESGRHCAWLAEADGVPVACVMLLWWTVPPHFGQHLWRRGSVSSVYTVPEYRRRGISYRLMTMLLDWARAEGLTRLILWSSEMARPLYAHLGFAPSHGLELNL